jgi:hypothetical protein
MTDKLEWDWPPEPPRKQRPRVEVLEPERPRVRVEVEVRHHRQPPSWIVPAGIIVIVLLLWRFKLGVLMLAALTGWPTIAAALTLVAILAVVARRERRAGRPF